MNLTVRIDASLLRYLDPHRREQVLRSAMTESMLFLENRVAHGTPVDTVALRGSLFHDLRGRWFGGLRGVVASPLEYAPAVEYGRRPGGRMPPVAAIERWAQRVIGVRGLGYIIARSIARRGTRGAFMFQTAARDGVRTVEAIFARHIRGSL